VTVHVETNGPVTTVIIDRPAARNAIDRATAQALAAAFRDFDADPAQHVAVLCGANGHFCAGADLKAFVANPGEWSLAEDGDAPLGPTRMLLSKPVIAAVSGYAVAGGLELALWCDLRVVEQTATFGVFCRRWGVPLIDGGTIRLSRLIGHSRAGPDPHRPPGGRRGSAGHRPGQPRGGRRRWRARRPRRWRRRSPPSRRPACATTGCRATSSGACRCPRR
jgi:enoyl-CoA hydratase/carnithine racemase